VGKKYLLIDRFEVFGIVAPIQQTRKIKVCQTYTEHQYASYL